MACCVAIALQWTRLRGRVLCASTDKTSERVAGVVDCSSGIPTDPGGIIASSAGVSGEAKRSLVCSFDFEEDSI